MERPEFDEFDKLQELKEIFNDCKDVYEIEDRCIIGKNGRTVYDEYALMAKLLAYIDLNIVRECAFQDDRFERMSAQDFVDYITSLDLEHIHYMGIEEELAIAKRLNLFSPKQAVEIFNSISSERLDAFSHRHSEIISVFDTKQIEFECHKSNADIKEKTKVHSGEGLSL